MSPSRCLPAAIQLAAAVALAACSATPYATAPSSQAATSSAAPSACATATATVTSITRQGGIDLTAGSMRSSVSADEAAGWAKSLGSAALKARSGKLAADLVSAQAAATDLSLNVTNANATRLIAALQKVARDCPGTAFIPSAAAS